MAIRYIMVVESPLTRRDEARLGFEVLHRRGLEIEVWDVSRLVLPNANMQWVEAPEITKPILIEDFHRFEELVNGLSFPNVLVLSAGLDKNFSRSRPEVAEEYWRILAQARCRIGALVTGSFPALNTSESRGLVLRALCRRPHLLVSRLGTRIVRDRAGESKRATASSQPMPELDFVWTGTTAASINPRLIGDTTRVVYVHTLDYDQVLAVPDPEVAEPLTTFIDCMGPSHPDYLTHSIHYSMPMARYRNQICQALDLLETSLGFRTVVAAHPRAEPGTMEAWYGGREVRYRETAALIARSSLTAMADPSTAVGLAVALRKPLVFFTSRHLQAENRLLLRKFSHELDAPLIRIKSKRPIRLPSVNPVAYARYMERYVKRPGTPSKAFWEVAADDIVRAQRVQRNP